MSDLSWINPPGAVPGGAARGAGEPDGPPPPAGGLARGEREDLPERRRSVSLEVQALGAKVHVGVGFRADGTVGELRVNAAKTGSALRLGMEAWAGAVSLALQHGASLEDALGPVVTSEGRAGSIYDAIGRAVLEEAPDGGGSAR